MIVHATFVNKKNFHNQEELECLDAFADFLKTAFHFIKEVKIIPPFYFEEALKKSEYKVDMYDAAWLDPMLNNYARRKNFDNLFALVNGGVVDFNDDIYVGGACLKDSFYVSLCRKIDNIPRTIQHEIGHGIGLEHHSNCLMSDDKTKVNYFCDDCLEKILNYKPVQTIK